MVGSGHSFTDIACTDGHLVDLDRYNRVLAVDPEARTATVQAGIRLEDLNVHLDRRGLALPNLGDIAYQTIAGATSTSTHGTGPSLTGLAGQIVAMRLVLADGSAVDCSPTEEPELFHCARVGLGALGHHLDGHARRGPGLQPGRGRGAHAGRRRARRPRRARRRQRPLRVLLGAAHRLGPDQAEQPHHGGAGAAAGALEEWRDDYLLQNYAFGALCRVGRVRPRWIPQLAKALPSAGRVTYVDRSYRVFASPRLVRFYEMEYAIPREAGVEALGRVRRFVEDSGLLLSFPVEVRFTAPDDIPLSTANGRESCYIAVHVFEGMEYRPYFEGVERIMDDYGGRPHWGKLHFQTATTLAERYPEWERFAAVRGPRRSGAPFRQPLPGPGPRPLTALPFGGQTIGQG